MRHRQAPRLQEDFPAYLAVFDERDWPAARPFVALVGSDRQWARFRWNRARAAWRKSHPGGGA